MTKLVWNFTLQFCALFSYKLCACHMARCHYIQALFHSGCAPCTAASEAWLQSSTTKYIRTALFQVIMKWGLVTFYQRKIHRTCRYKPENLHHFSNLSNHFWFNAISRKWSMCTLIFCRRLAECDIAVTPSVKFMNWLHRWYYHAANLVPSPTAVAFLNNTSDKHKSTSPSAVQVKNWWKTINIKEKLDIISRLEKGGQIYYMCHNVWYAHISVHTIRDNADRIAESAKSGTKVFVYQDYHSPIRNSGTKNYGCESLTFLLY